jgi:hypothetical protein
VVDFFWPPLWWCACGGAKVGIPNLDLFEQRGHWHSLRTSFPAAGRLVSYQRGDLRDVAHVGEEVARAEHGGGRAHAVLVGDDPDARHLRSRSRLFLSTLVYGKAHTARCQLLGWLRASRGHTLVGESPCRRSSPWGCAAPARRWGGAPLGGNWGPCPRSARTR